MNSTKRIGLYCWLLMSIGGMLSSCAQHAILTQPGGAAHSPKYVLFRVASTDHQFTDAAECLKQATVYYNNTTLKPGAPPQPLPNIYRWEVNGTEVRFVVVPPTAAQPALSDYIVDYEEVDKVSKVTLRRVYDDLISKGYKNEQLPVKDDAALIVNGHLTERALLKKPITPTGGVKSVAVVRSNLRGIIINPPYP